MAEPIGFEGVEPSTDEKKEKEMPESHSDDQLVVQGEGGRPRLNTAARVSARLCWRVRADDSIPHRTSVLRGMLSLSVPVCACVWHGKRGVWQCVLQ